MKHLLNLLIPLILLGCGTKKAEEAQAEKRAYDADRNPVEIQVLQSGTFARQLVSNGKLTALRKSELRFRTSGVLEFVGAANGKRVSQGTVLAKLNADDAQQQLAQNQNQLQKAQLDLHDVLIGMGYDGANLQQVPPEKLALAQVRSGYTTALHSVEVARRTLEGCELKAPFAGVVANIVRKSFETVGSEAFCLLIDDARFEVAFQIMETELPEVHLNDAVQIKPFSADKRVSGRISEINPLIGADGLVTVKALVDNPGSFIEGMNVEVLIERQVPNQFVVPKSAVVLRDNQHVLFKIVKGRAYWNYVKIAMENSSSYSVYPDPDKQSASLTPGDTIVISGNLNLAHESEVVF
jgi:membrane fusion protein, multidrug efflux system